MSQVGKVGGDILHWLPPTPKSEGANAPSPPVMPPLPVDCIFIHCTQ